MCDTDRAPSSQLCREESWERVYYPPAPQQRDHRFQKPARRGCCTSLEEKAQACYCSLKERCVTRCVLCGLTGRGCSWGAMYHNYFLRSKAVLVILLMNALFSTAMYGITVKVLQYIFRENYSPVPVVIAYGTTLLLFPIVGHISDTCIRRHTVLELSIWLAWAGFAVLGIAFSIESYSSNFDVVNRYCILPIVFVVLSISYVCFLSNIIPFALDQMQGASHIHYSSFFYWWYWTLSVGVALFNIPEYCSDNLELKILIHVEVALVCVTAVLILDILFKHWFVIEPHCANRLNPLLQICRVLRYALRPPAYQRIPSAMHHELDLSSCNRLELAKRRFGGKFETEQVEDTRTFLYVGLMLAAIGFLLVVYFGVLGTIPLVKSHFISDVWSVVFHHNSCDFKISMLSVINPLVLLLLLPVLDLLVVPFLRHIMLHPSILKRLGIGALCVLLSALSLLMLEGAQDQVFVEGSGGTCGLLSQQVVESNSEQGVGGISSYWLILPELLITLAEIFIYIPGFEFICAQAPYNMRSLLIGMFFSIQRLASLAALLLQYLFNRLPIKQDHSFRPVHGYTCTFWFYLGTSILALFAVVFFSVVACKYKKRKRDDTFNQVGMLEEYFSTGRIHSSRWT